MSDYSLGGYPAGAANDPKAPWNETGKSYLVSVTISKYFYAENKDEAKDYALEEINSDWDIDEIEAI